ncbi:MAG: hypothetical protein WBM44_24670 [Waterburya sp.]
MNSKAIHNESIFQQAVATVEALSIEDQTILIEIIQNRLRQKKRDQLKQEIEDVRQEYREEQVKFGSVEDFLAELDRE